MNYPKWLVLLAGIFLLPVLNAKPIQISNHTHHIEIHLSFQKAPLKSEQTRVAAGTLLSLQAEQFVFPESFKKFPSTLKGINGIIVQKRGDKELQVIIQHAEKTGLKIYRNTFVDSVYHVNFYVFKTSWYKQSWLANLLAGIEKQKNGRQEDALVNFKRSIQLKPRNPDAYFRAAQYRLYKNEPGNALINLKKAVRMGCDSVRVNYFFAEVYGKLGKAEQARQYKKQYDEMTARFIKSKPKQTEMTAANPEKEIQTETKNIKSEKSSPASGNSRSSLNYVFIGFIGLTIIIITILVLSQKKSNKFMDDFQEDNPVTDDGEDTFDTSDPAEYESEDLPPSSPYEEDDENPITESDEPSDATDSFTENKPPETVSKAKELNLGVGELELAINLQSRLKNKKRLAGKEEIIIELYNRGMSINDISKELNLNFGEVDLVIGLNKHRLNKKLS